MSKKNNLLTASEYMQQQSIGNLEFKKKVVSEEIRVGAWVENLAIGLACPILKLGNNIEDQKLYSSFEAFYYTGLVIIDSSLLIKSLVKPIKIDIGERIRLTKYGKTIEQGRFVKGPNYKFYQHHSEYILYENDERLKSIAFDDGVTIYEKMLNDLVENKDQVLSWLNEHYPEVDDKELSSNISHYFNLIVDNTRCNIPIESLEEIEVMTIQQTESLDDFSLADAIKKYLPIELQAAASYELNKSYKPDIKNSSSLWKEVSNKILSIENLVVIPSETDIYSNINTPTMASFYRDINPSMRNEQECLGEVSLQSNAAFAMNEKKYGKLKNHAFDIFEGNKNKPLQEREFDINNYNEASKYIEKKLKKYTQEIGIPYTLSPTNGSNTIKGWLKSQFDSK